PGGSLAGTTRLKCRPATGKKALSGEKKRFCKEQTSIREPPGSPLAFVKPACDGAQAHGVWRSNCYPERDLIMTDGHEGILAALREQFPATVCQRCAMHKQRNVMNAIPKREREPVAAEWSE